MKGVLEFLSTLNFGKGGGLRLFGVYTSLVMVTDGGKQPLQRPGYYTRHGVRIKQHMVNQVYVVKCDTYKTAFVAGWSQSWHCKRPTNSGRGKVWRRGCER